MKVFLTGASGMLAAEMIPELVNNNHEVFQFDINAKPPSVRALDITDHEKVKSFVNETNPDIIFHFAAETNVDLCEQDPDYAYNANAKATENIALICQEKDIPLVYISTAGVFYGDKETPYVESDEPNPINVYGKSKLEGEKAVKKLLTKYFILRAGWMIGGWEIDKKFVYKIVQQLQAGNTKLKVVSDKRGTPTFTKYFAKNVLPVINTGKYGLYHMANKGTCSRYDIALKIVEFTGLKDKVTVHEIDSSQFPLPAPRADSEMMDNTNLEKLGLNNMPHWEDALKEYIVENKDKVAA